MTNGGFDAFGAFFFSSIEGNVSPWLQSRLRSLSLPKGRYWAHTPLRTVRLSAKIAPKKTFLNVRIDVFVNKVSKFLRIFSREYA